VLTLNAPCKESVKSSADDSSLPFQVYNTLALLYKASDIAI